MTSDSEDAPYFGGYWTPETGFRPLDKVSAYPDFKLSAQAELDKLNIPALVAQAYDDYDAHSTENEPPARFMVTLVGMTGFLVKADIVIMARDEDHAEALAEGIAAACGGATVDNVYQL